MWLNYSCRMNMVNAACKCKRSANRRRIVYMYLKLELEMLGSSLTQVANFYVNLLCGVHEKAQCFQFAW